MKATPKYFFLLSLLTFVSSLDAFSQISSGEMPPSFFEKSDKNHNMLSSALAVTIEKPDLSEIKKEDKIEDQYKEIPWRFGVVLDLEKSTSNGFWEIDSNKAVWKLKIKAKDALSLNLNFKKFHLSDNAQLFIYNQDYSDVLGALTAKNNKTDSLFAIRPIKGDEINFELHCPLNEKDQNIIETRQLVYGYRSLQEKTNKAFNSSGSCNININCPEGSLWQDVKRSVVIILSSNNSRLCTGTLINNIEEDSIPYVLTASHCNISSNSIFVFNYESPQCNPSVDGSLNKSISGATLRAEEPTSDFTLFELSAKPPASYEVYYAGWSARDETPVKSTGIHHPRGDVMKISHDFDSASSSKYDAFPNNYHWNVRNWEISTTEVGSSGSPLFDQNQRIVGQLHGGDANCGNPINDFYGKFNLSWDDKSASTRQLKYWLDPNNTGLKIVDGLDTKVASNNYDVKIISNTIPAYSCDTNLQPNLNFKNNGSTTLSHVRFSIILNGQFHSFINWNGQLARGKQVSLQLPIISYLSGKNSVSITVDSIFPGNDQNSSNNTSIAEVTINKTPYLFHIKLKTDDYGYETTWEVTEQGQSSPLYINKYYPEITGGQIYHRDICLYDSCFTFKLRDSFGDGFNSSVNGNGYLVITNTIGDTIVFENNFTTSAKDYNFCASGTTGISLPQISESKPFKIYPNPSERQGKIQIKSAIETYEISILDVNGRVVYMSKPHSYSTSISPNIGSGIYFIKATNLKTNRSEVNKLIIN